MSHRRWYSPQVSRDLEGFRDLQDLEERRVVGELGGMWRR
jgi:hypothetical protein